MSTAYVCPECGAISEYYEDAEEYVEVPLPCRDHEGATAA